MSTDNLMRRGASTLSRSAASTVGGRPPHVLSERMVEKSVVVPTDLTRSELRWARESGDLVPEAAVRFRERIVEVAKPVAQETIVEVNEVEFFETSVEFADTGYQERIKEVSRVELEEEIVEVPKLMEIEKIVEVPEIEYLEVPVEKIVEIVEYEDQVITKEVPVDEYIEVLVNQDKLVEVEKTFTRNLPVPVELISEWQFKMPILKPARRVVPLEIRVPRFIEVPVPTAYLSSAEMEEAFELKSLLDKIVCGASVSLGDLEKLSKLARDQSDLIRLPTSQSTSAEIKNKLSTQLDSLSRQRATVPGVRYMTSLLNIADSVGNNSVLRGLGDHLGWVWRQLSPDFRYQETYDGLPSTENDIGEAKARAANDVNVSPFPIDDWIGFLSAQLSPQKAAGLHLLRSRVSQLAAQLAGCAESDGRCAATLGDLYMKRMLPPTVRRGIEGDWMRSDHFQRAVQLWWHGAALADREALYRLAVFYSSFPNPPTPPKIQVMGPKSALNAIGPAHQGEDAAAKLQTIFSTGEDEAFERMGLAMRVLDLPETDPASHAAESELVAWYLNSKSHRAVSAARSGLRWPMRKRDSLAILFFYAAAHEGHVGANLALGYRHLYGIGVPRRCSTAAAYYTRVAAAVQAATTYGIPTAAELIRLNLPPGELFAASASARSTIAAFQLHLAEQESPVMETAVGRKFLLGSEGFPKDPFTAARYFLSAAAKNEARATSFLGYMSAMGVGLSTNYTLAEALFRSSIALSGETLEEVDPMALNGLGWLYFAGHTRAGYNIPLAVQYFNASAAQGFADAQYNMGSLYVTGEGVKKSFSTASQYLLRAVEQGHTSAAYLLGLLHVNGLGVVKDCFLGTTLLKRAAERHSWVAEMGHQAYSLQSSQQWDAAVFAYWLVAEAGVEVAQANIGVLLDGGGNRPVVNAEPVMSQIKRLYKGRSVSRSRRLPFQTARGVLGALRRAIPWLAGGTLVLPVSLFTPPGLRPSAPINRFFAQRYWTMAAQQRSTSAKARVGDYAYHGWGTEQALRDSDSPLYTTDELCLLIGDCDREASCLVPDQGGCAENFRMTLEETTNDSHELEAIDGIAVASTDKDPPGFRSEWPVSRESTEVLQPSLRSTHPNALLHNWVTLCDDNQKAAQPANIFYKRRKPDFSLAHSIYSSIASLPLDQGDRLSPIVASSLSMTAARSHAALGYMAQFGQLPEGRPSLSVAYDHYWSIAARNATFASVTVLLTSLMRAVALYEVLSRDGLLYLLNGDYRMRQLVFCVALFCSMVVLRSVLRKRVF